MSVQPFLCVVVSMVSSVSTVKDDRVLEKLCIIHSNCQDEEALEVRFKMHTVCIVLYAWKVWENSLVNSGKAYIVFAV